MNRGGTGSARTGAVRVLVAHPSPDLYGSDWQLVETIHGLIETGHEVLVALPQDGPLVAVLRDAGARVAVMPFTVLRKALLSPTGLAKLSAQAAPEVARLRSVIRASRADVVLSNTVTIPWWPVAASAAGIPVLAHVHEAEDTQRRVIRAGLNAPLLAASRIVANSGAARDALLDAQPRLASRTEVVHNGVAGPDRPLEPLRTRRPGDSFRIAMVGRLSPRKGVDVALDAVGLLRRSGVDASLSVCGSVFPGYEWFEAELRERAGRADLAGAVAFHGYVSPTRPLLEAADVVLVPSFGESFGNVAVEGMLAGRPVVACDGLGLGEVLSGAPRTGRLVPPGDAVALASTTVPGSPAALADEALLAAIIDSGEQIEGLSTTVHSATGVPVGREAAESWTGATAVRVSQSQAPSVRIAADGSRREVPAQARREVVLVLVPDPWRVAEVLQAD